MLFQVVWSIQMKDIEQMSTIVYYDVKARLFSLWVETCVRLYLLYIRLLSQKSVMSVIFFFDIDGT